MSTLLGRVVFTESEKRARIPEFFRTVDPKRKIFRRVIGDALRRLNETEYDTLARGNGKLTVAWYLYDFHSLSLCSETLLTAALLIYYSSVTLAPRKYTREDERKKTSWSRSCSSKEDYFSPIKVNLIN